MIPFSAPTEDILFSLNHIALADRLEDWDPETSAEILGHFAHFAEGVIAPLNGVGDHIGAQLENGRVRMPDGFADAFAQLAEGGWQGLTAPERFGGMGLSNLIGAGYSEIFSGANHSMQMLCNLVPGAIATLLRYGSDAQQAAWIPKLADGSVLSTMCLTEPGAGSDLSAIRTQASQNGNDWLITGEKIFISGGDQDMSSSILHLVLARTGSKEDGLRGLSLFLCTPQSGITVSRIEEKMGLHASPTCQMVFDAATAELVGDIGGGLKSMFTLMNHARLDVALQGVAHAARAGQIARAYAADRKQGRDPGGAPARLDSHADVRRMLDHQRILEIGTRAMCHLALAELELGERPALVEFLTPLCKVLGSEAGVQAANLGMQVLGGYGYLEEYGMSQIWRDARITGIYEGANGIHMNSLATRGLRPGGGSDNFSELVKEMSGRRDVGLEAWQALRAQILDTGESGRLAHRFAEMSGTVLARAIWCRIADKAALHPDQPELNRLASLVLQSTDFDCRIT